MKGRLWGGLLGLGKVEVFVSMGCMGIAELAAGFRV